MFNPYNPQVMLSELMTSLDPTPVKEKVITLTDELQGRLEVSRLIVESLIEKTVSLEQELERYKSHFSFCRACNEPVHGWHKDLCHDCYGARGE